METRTDAAARESMMFAGNDLGATDFALSVRTRISTFLRWFRKPRVTISLILVLLSLYSLGLVIPQKVFFDSRAHYDGWLAEHYLLGPLLDRIGFTNIYTSPVTIVFLIMFYANLLLVVGYRVPLILRRTLLLKQGDPLAFTLEDCRASQRCRELDVRGIDAAAVVSRTASFFQRRTWFVRQSADREKTLAVRNRFSALGFLLFHLSFLLCLSGGLMIYYTRFSGRIALTEREAFEGDLRQFYVIDRQPKVFRELPSLSFRLEEAVFEYEERQPTRLDAVLSIRFEDAETIEHIGVNQPVNRGAYTILAVNAGVSPLFVIRDATTGADLDGAWVRLDAAEDREDMFRFDILGDIDLYARFFPDYVIEDGAEGTRSLNIRNPAFRISARRNGDIVAEETIKMGQRMLLGPHVIEFRDLRYWTAFQVVREMGEAPLVAGFALAVIGLIMRLIFYRKEVRIVLTGDRLLMDGTSEYYRHSFAEELDRLADALRRHIAAGRADDRDL